MTIILRRQARDAETPSTVRRPAGWPVVAAQECRDLWVGRGLVLVLAVSLLLSVVTYMAASNQVLNFLEEREAVNLTPQIAVAVGVLVTLVVSADGISGERERGTLESRLLTQVPRRAIVVGKAVAALTLWFAVFVVSIPYVWVLGRGVSVVVTALLLGLLAGTLLAVALAAIGLLISAASGSNKASLSVSLFCCWRCSRRRNCRAARRAGSASCWSGSTRSVRRCTRSARYSSTVRQGPARSR